MHDIENLIYRQYVGVSHRKSADLESSPGREAGENSATHYIWRTQEDGKVRPSHAANNRKVFSWKMSPETGHPGADYNCRCWAQPYRPEVEEFLFQIVTSTVDDGLYRWAWYEFLLHFYFGEGEAVRLSHVGHLQTIINASQEHVFRGVERQVLKEARAKINGALGDTFERTYPYYSVSFIHGRSTVKGRYSGSVSRQGEVLHIAVDVEYHFSDTFTDPFDIRELTGGTSDPRARDMNELIDSELGGQFYEVYDHWTTHIFAIVHADADKSGYK